MKRINHPRRVAYLGGVAAILFSLAGALPLAALTVKDAKGRSLEIEVLAYTESTQQVKFKRADGKIFTVKLDLFDPASQQAIIDAAPVAFPRLEIQVSNGKRRAREGDSSYMKRMEVSTSVKIENETIDIDLPKTQFTLLLVGRNMERFDNRDDDYCQILDIQKADFDVPAGETREREFKPIITSYDSDRDDTNIGGFEYEGYLFIGQNEAGEIVIAESNMGPVKVGPLEDPEKLKATLSLKKGQDVERDLTPKK